MISSALDIIERLLKEQRIDETEYKTVKSALYSGAFGAWEFTENSLPPIGHEVLLSDQCGEHIFGELAIIKMGGSWVLNWQYLDQSYESYISIPLEDYPYWTYIPKTPELKGV